MKFKFFLFIIIISNLCIYNGFACSIVMFADGEKTFFGNNEDGANNEEALFHFVARKENKFGYFYITLPTLEDPFIASYNQGGLNEKGLAFDITATPLKNQVELIIPSDTPYPEGNLMDKVLEEASNVDEAIQIILKYKASKVVRELMGVSEFRQMQVLISDSFGNSAIIGIGKDQNISVIKKDQKKYQVLTNFSASWHENSVVNETIRFNIANDFFKDKETAKIKDMISVLAAIHVEGPASTIYSTIYDLKTLDIRIYHFHDFTYEKKMNLLDELNIGDHEIKLSDLFKERPLFSKFVLTRNK